MKTAKNLRIPNVDRVQDPVVKEVLKQLFDSVSNFHLTAFQDIRLLDPIYTEVDPNGSRKGRKGQIAIYNDGTQDHVKINADGEDFWIMTSTPVGTLAEFAAGTAPHGYLECDGSAVSRTTYATLFAVISDDYGNGDGSTTFNLPDYRGYFLRGYDHGAGNDPDAASRTDRGDTTTGDNVGTVQADAFDEHSHNVPVVPTDAPGSNPYVEQHDNTGAASTVATTNAGGSETRPKNKSVMICIKF